MTALNFKKSKITKLPKKYVLKLQLCLYLFTIFQVILHCRQLFSSKFSTPHMVALVTSLNAISLFALSNYPIFSAYDSTKVIFDCKNYLLKTMAKQSWIGRSTFRPGRSTRTKCSLWSKFSRHLESMVKISLPTLWILKKHMNEFLGINFGRLCSSMALMVS